VASARPRTLGQRSGQIFLDRHQLVALALRQVDDAEPPAASFLTMV